MHSPRGNRCEQCVGCCPSDSGQCHRKVLLQLRIKEKYRLFHIQQADWMLVVTLQARAAAKEEKGSEAAQQSQAETVSQVPAGQPAAAVVVTVMKRTADSNNEEPMVTVKKQKKSRLQADTKQAANGPDEARLSNGDSTDIAAAPTMQKLETIKWKKMAVQALKGSRDNCTKLSKLQKQLRVAANVSDVLSADADTLIASRLKGSSQFVIKGKMVSLSSTVSS